MTHQALLSRLGVQASLDQSLPRSCLRWLCIFFSSSRFLCAFSEGLVGTRCGRSSSASFRRTTKRERAIWRLRFWLLEPWAVTCKTPWESSREASACSSFSLVGSSKLGDPATSNRSVALVWARLTCWPPGPRLGEKRNAISDNGIWMLSVTAMTLLSFTIGTLL